MRGFDMVKVHDAFVRNGPTKSEPGSTACCRSVSATSTAATGFSTDQFRRTSCKPSRTSDLVL